MTNPPTTTTPKPQTEPPEDIIEDTTSLQSVLNYVNSLGRTTDEYYNIGAGLGHDGSDYGKAKAVYNWIRGTSAEIVKYSQQQQCTLVKVWDLDVGMRFSHRMPGTVIWQTWYVWREHGMC